MRLPIVLVIAAVLAFPAAALAADPLRGQQWNLDMVEADAAHATAAGHGAVVAVIDTGVHEAHPDLQGRLLPGYDWVQGDAAPQDENGHGTHIAGIVAANTGNGEGVESVAPGASVLPLRVLDEEGGGFTEDAARAIDYAIAHGADVINLSLSGDPPLVGDLLDPTFAEAIDRALDAGIVVVAVAGNTGLPLCENPVSQGRVLCVGAVDRRRMRSSYSGFGFGLALVAPGGSGAPTDGENVLSTYLAPLYEEVAGTSQASPHVAAVAALLVSKGITGQAAVRRILATATDVGAEGPDFVYGAGIVNARRAVEGLPPDGAAPPAPSGNPVEPPAGSAARVSIPRVQSLRTVLRRGILVRCQAAGAGPCTATATLRGRRVARGSTTLTAGRTRAFRARVTRTGRRLLGRAGRPARVRITVALPGAAVQRRTVTLRR
jgi:subtilisin family serine protease